MMRLILSYAALALTHFALRDLAQSRLHDQLSDEALRRGEAKMRSAQALAARCGMCRR